MDPQTLEREYSPSSCINGNYQPFIEAYRTQSQRARAHSEALGGRWQTLAYGLKPSQSIEICVPPIRGDGDGDAGAGAKRPVLVYIHGGYWQELGAHDSLFAADACIARGVAFAAVDYTLAPAASVAQIVIECRLAANCLADNAQALGLDVDRFVVCGSSAGGHLAAMMALPNWQPDALSPRVRWRAAILVSGVFELEPLVGTSINGALGLDVAAAQSASPCYQPVEGFATAVVAWGSVETAEFKRQSRAFASQLGAAGVPCETLEIEGRNHFDVIMDIADPATALGQRTWGYLQSGG